MIEDCVNGDIISRVIVIAVGWGMRPDMRRSVGRKRVNDTDMLSPCMDGIIAQVLITSN